ncbi:hypothetical protein ABSA28_00881 [Candidatus Hepatincolaceae symbiont of Richtersius coronifer]
MGMRKFLLLLLLCFFYLPRPIYSQIFPNNHYIIISKSYGQSFYLNSEDIENKGALNPAGLQIFNQSFHNNYSIGYLTKVFNKVYLGGVIDFSKSSVFYQEGPTKLFIKNNSYGYLSMKYKFFTYKDLSFLIGVDIGLQNSKTNIQSFFPKNYNYQEITIKDIIIKQGEKIQGELINYCDAGFEGYYVYDGDNNQTHIISDFSCSISQVVEKQGNYIDKYENQEPLLDFNTYVNFNIGFLSNLNSNISLGVFYILKNTSAIKINKNFNNEIAFKNNISIIDQYFQFLFSFKL